MTSFVFLDNIENFLNTFENTLENIYHNIFMSNARYFEGVKKRYVGVDD